MTECGTFEHLNLFRASNFEFMYPGLFGLGFYCLGIETRVPSLSFSSGAVAMRLPTAGPSRS